MTSITNAPPLLSPLAAIQSNAPDQASRMLPESLSPAVLNMECIGLHTLQGLQAILGGATAGLTKIQIEVARHALQGLKEGGFQRSVHCREGQTIPQYGRQVLTEQGLRVGILVAQVKPVESGKYELARIGWLGAAGQRAILDIAQPDSADLPVVLTGPSDKSGCLGDEGPSGSLSNIPPAPKLVSRVLDLDVDTPASGTQSSAARAHSSERGTMSGSFSRQSDKKKSTRHTITEESFSTLACDANGKIKTAEGIKRAVNAKGYTISRPLLKKYMSNLPGYQEKNPPLLTEKVSEYMLDAEGNVRTVNEVLAAIRKAGLAISGDRVTAGLRQARGRLVEPLPKISSEHLDQLLHKQNGSLRSWETISKAVHKLRLGVTKTEIEEAISRAHTGRQTVSGDAPHQTHSPADANHDIA